MEERKKGGTLKKFIVSIISGLLFGIFAAVSFYAVKEVGEAFGIVSDSKESAKTAKVEAIIREDDIANRIKEDAQAFMPAGNIDSKDNVNKDSSSILRTSVGTAIVSDVTTVVEKKMPTIVSITKNYTANAFYFTQEAKASGSGIIIGSNDEELLVVTNYHVIENNDSLDVIFCDNNSAKAYVKGTDRKNDLAVIAVNLKDIDGSTLKVIDYAVIGDSDNLKVGEPVIAIGNALGYGQSVTTGVVSALNREVGNEEKGTFIQTDAAINPGNSGGALMNLAGEVIGINSSKIGGAAVEGMGYAIPISVAKPIIEELMVQKTKATVDINKQSYLGISGATITSQEAMFYGYPEGVYVATVYEDSAAEKAGIEKGDFITELNGEKITSMEQLKKELTYYEGGSKIELTIERYSVTGYKEIVLEVTLGYKNEFENS